LSYTALLLDPIFLLDPWDNLSLPCSIARGFRLDNPVSDLRNFREADCCQECSLSPFFGVWLWQFTESGVSWYVVIISLFIFCATIHGQERLSQIKLFVVLTRGITAELEYPSFQAETLACIQYSYPSSEGLGGLNSVGAVGAVGAAGSVGLVDSGETSRT